MSYGPQVGSGRSLKDAAPSKEVGQDRLGWTPAFLDLLFWYRAHDIGQADGTSVSSWPDFSPRGRDLSSTSADEPTYQTNVVNGYPVVRFNSSTNRPLEAPQVGVGEFTIWACYNVPTDPSGGRHYGWGSDTVAGDGSDVVNMGVDPSIRFNDGNISSHSLSHPYGSFFVRTTTRSGASGGTYEEWFDHDQALSATSFSDERLHLDFYISNQLHSLDSIFDVDAVEYFAVPYVVSSDIRSRGIEYLHRKYGL